MQRVLLLIAFMLSAMCAVAAEPPVGELDTVLHIGSVEVTSIKQGATLRGKAIAATLIDALMAERNHISALKDASEVVPNFYIPDYGSRMTTSVYVRGLGARIDQPVVGMNVDNVPVLIKEGYDFEMVDIERIEILRGPQSTLYGRNTMGGVVNIYTLSPFNWQGVKLGVEYGSGNTLKARASTYQKILPNLATAVSAYYTRTDGFFENLNTGKNCDTEQQGGGRFKLAWRGDRWHIENTLAFSLTKQGGYPYAYAGEDILDAQGKQIISNGEISYNDPCSYERVEVSDGVTVRYDAPKFSVSSITSYRYHDDKMTLDQDFTPLSYFTLVQAREEHAATEEIVLRSKEGAHGKYNWLCGAFGFFKHSDMNAPVQFKRTGIEELIIKNASGTSGIPLIFDNEELLFDSYFDMPTWGVAAYHESSLTLGKFLLTAGVRFDYERARLDYRCESDARGMFGVAPITPDNFADRLHNSFFEILPKVTATVRFDARNSLYASVAKGYKAGGFNTQMFSEVQQSRLMKQMGVAMHRMSIDEIVAYKPEYSWNYEIGAHAATADGRFVAEAALFYIDCRDQQLTVFPEGQTTGRMMTNAGKTRSFGAEMSARVSPFRNFDVSLSYGYTNARFVEFRSGKSDYAGQYVPYAPQHTAAARATYQIAIQTRWLKQITLGVGYKGVGPIYWNEENSLKQNYYSLLDASVRLAGPHYSVEVWGKNLAGAEYAVFH
ncbi:MAG: TonB-dependent receptor, partial [Alistipes sp.]|nr:TonB-dependent receptor [Alistipes sp.]